MDSMKPREEGKLTGYLHLSPRKKERSRLMQVSFKNSQAHEVHDVWDTLAK